MRHDFIGLDGSVDVGRGKCFGVVFGFKDFFDDEVCRSVRPQFRGVILMLTFVSLPFVIRTVKEMGWNGFSIDSARVPLTNMGQTLFEPPNVAGWQLGRAWFGTGQMLARMNFAATVASNQKFNLARSFSANDRAQTSRLLDAMLQRFTPAPYSNFQDTEDLTLFTDGPPRARWA